MRRPVAVIAVLALLAWLSGARVATAGGAEFTRGLACGFDGAAAGDDRVGSPVLDPDLEVYDQEGNSGVISGRDRVGYVAFTFDDGPNPKTTTRILDALDRYDIPATFYVVGSRITGTSRFARRNAAVFADTVKRGYHIGNHTLKHAKLSLVSERVMREEVDLNTDVLRERLGYAPRTFRPPYGAMNARSRAYVLGQGFSEIRWSIDTQDFDPERAKTMRKDTIAEIVRLRGGIVLMHDTKDVTADNIAGILDDLERENCRLLDAGAPIIAPVTVHYFLKNPDGSPRSVPRHVAERTARYRARLPARCQARADATTRRRVRQRANRTR